MKNYSLSQLTDAFETAYAAADWALIAELNSFTQPCVENEMAALRASANASGADPEQAMVTLKPQLERLSTIYQAMQTQCAEQRDSLALQLGHLSSGQVGVKEYSATSNL